MEIAPQIEGLLGLPAVSWRGVVLFAHGSGSSRFSPRNTQVAARLRAVGLVTLLFDLLTEKEGRSRARVFDVPLLAQRLRRATVFVTGLPEMAGLPVGYFGASTGAAAAMVAAAEPGLRIGAVVVRGGRVDLAGSALEQVRAPTLLIVGAEDTEVLELNRAARTRLRCPSALSVVPGAGHLFDEPGAMQEVVMLTLSWFLRHLALPDA